jgi:hypothetical protein
VAAAGRILIANARDRPTQQWPAGWSWPRKSVGTTEDCPGSLWLAVAMKTPLRPLTRCRSREWSRRTSPTRGVPWPRTRRATSPASRCRSTPGSHQVAKQQPSSRETRTDTHEQGSSGSSNDWTS